MLEDYARVEGGVLGSLFKPGRRYALPPGGDGQAGAVFGISGGEPELLAEAGSARARVIVGLAELDMNPAHDRACLREAEALIAAPGLEEPGLRDLEALPFVTIDNPGSRDLDQALHLDRADSGWRVRYALADAGHYIRAGQPLFEEALRRGATFYAPGIAAPMLPPSLSEGLVSLNPQVPRRALVFDIRLDGDGGVVDTAVYQARIRSRAKLNYGGVQDWLDARDVGRAHPLDGQAFSDSLALLRPIGEARMALARARDVVEHDRREPQLQLDPDNPYAFALRMRRRNDVERYNEQISLLCNIEGARWLLERERLSPDLQAVFRVHLPPEADRLARLDAAIDALVDARGLGDRWRWRREGPLADYLEGLPGAPEHDRLRQAIGRQIMVANHASHFSAEPGPHHALGVDGYARFSSPMREIAGVFTHKELLEASGVLAPRPAAEDQALRERVIEAANGAKRRQRQLDKRFQLAVIEQLLRDDLARPVDARPWRAGTLMGIRGTRLYLSLDGFALDIKAYADDLSRRWGGRYAVEGGVARSDSGEGPVLRIGDGVRVRTESWDERRGRYIMDVRPLP